MLVIFGSVFALLGLLTLSLVIDEPKVGANGGFLIVSVMFFASAAWIFGTALRMPFRTHPLGDAKLVLPESAGPGDEIAVRVEIFPAREIVVEEAIAELTGVEVEVAARAERRELYRESSPLLPRGKIGGPVTLEAILRIPQNAAPTKEGPPRHRGWTVRVVVVTDSGPDWTAEQPIRVT